MDIRQIEAKDTYNLRHKILRPQGTVEDCHFTGDPDDNTFHLGAFLNDELVSVASFYLDNHPEIPDEYQYRLRGMATLESHRGKGLSRALLRVAFPIIKNNHVKVVWCNARSSAVPFYEKVGFKKIGSEFDIKDIGPHYLMIKHL